MLPPIDSKESWIGVYCNKPNSIENAVAFSSEKLYVNKHGTWVSVTYRDILENKITQNKHEASEILVRTPNYSLIVPVHGGDDKVREAFEVLRFLNRVKEDVNRQNS